MEQNPSYIRISELVEMAKQRSPQRPTECDHALGLIVQTFNSIDKMTIEEREEVMNRLTGWMLTEKFEAKGHSVLSGLQNYCIADCLDEDPTWTPPAHIIATNLLPRRY